MSQSACSRFCLPKTFVLLCFLGSAGLIGYGAQPPKEQEETKGKTTKKIVVDDDDVKDTVKKKIAVDDDDAMNRKPGQTTGIPPDVRLEELSRAADEARNVVLKDIYGKYIVPFDRITEGSTVSRVKPIPVRKDQWPNVETVGITPIDSNGKEKETRAAKVSDVKNSLEIFETIVQREAERLQKQKIEGLTNLEQLAAAEKLLLAALRFHDYSTVDRKVDGVPKNLRRGKGWDEVREPLVAKLKSVELDYLRASVAANDVARIKEIVGRLIAYHSKDIEVAQAVAGVQVGEAERLLRSGTDQDCIAARKAMDELEKTFPAAGGEPAKKVKAQLRELALKALNRAKEKVAVGDERTARDELVRAEALDPELDGIRDMQRKLRVDYPILYVGVRQYPQNMTPTTARLDSEKQAIELLFEGLLEEVPDETGAVQFRPGCALAMPTPFPGGREFLLRSFRPESSKGFVSHDVVGTVNMLRTRPHTWAAYPLAWLAPEPPVPKDDDTVRISFGLAPPDPRSALTFKVLPARWLNENGRPIDDERFAESPFGTGPFVLHSNPQSSGGSGPREMVFVNSASYGRNQDREGLPRLREVRLVEASKLDPVKAFQDGKLHLLPDVPTTELVKYTDPSSPVKNKVDIVTAAVNRRVYILAVNLRRPELQNKQLRQGISYAIDREDVLRKVYRGGNPDVHKPMTGPFPPNSWIKGKGPGGPTPLLDLNYATLHLKNYLADQGAKNTLELSFQEGDPQAKEACDEIKKQIEAVFPAGVRKLSINLVKVPLNDLLVQVQDQHTSFDLAYVPFDYPDDWYPFALGAALDPSAADRRGRNWFGFRLPETNPDDKDQELGRALVKLRGYRDFAGELLPQSLEIAKLFNQSLPFIPLWQLDRHMVVSKRLKVFVDDTTSPVNARLLNQSLLFQGVARWRLE